MVITAIPAHMHTKPGCNRHSFSSISIQMPSASVLRSFPLHRNSITILPEIHSSAIMLLQILLHAVLTSLLLASLFSLFASDLINSDNIPIPSFAFGWLDGKDTFMAGDTACIKVKVLGNFEVDKYELPFHPNITVNDKMGDSSYISGVAWHFPDDVNNWRISFVPFVAGLFNVLLSDTYFKIYDSSLHFRVGPGTMYASASVVSWKHQINEFVAGTKASVLVLPKDAFGNNIFSTIQGPNSYNFMVFASNANGSKANVLNITNLGWNGFGYICIEFIVSTAGNLLLHVEEKNQSLNGSPLAFKVNPGVLDVLNCVVRWKSDTKSFQLFSMMEAFIYQHDLHGNLVPELYAFDVEVFEKETNLSTPIADLHFKQVTLGVQVFTFTLEEPGDFILVVSDKEQNILVSHMPYDFNVYIGYCDGMNSIINGSGLNDSVAGGVSKFSVFLKDAYQYPSPVESEMLQVNIVREFDSNHLPTSIYPLETVNGNWSTGRLSNDRISNVKSVRNWTKATAFNVFYAPEKSGTYEIRIFCGNVPLNGGYAFRKEVSAGEVNMSFSGVVKFVPKVPKLIRNEIVVQLVDSFSNPILFQQSKLKLEIGSINRSGFSTWMFLDNQDGSYTGSYLVKDVGTYEICASFDGNRFLPCPFGVNVYSGEYFPKAYPDVVFVWEDESIAFDALQNDYYAGANANIIQYSKPRHGSLFQYGQLFRYTPFKGFYGNDSFSYIISDANGNFASGDVSISVLSIPPQFVSFPSQLQAIEDVLSPRFGGFPGLKITYSDLMENISITLSAHFGTVFLSPMLMQFWQPIWSELSVKNVGLNAKDLILEGNLEVINFALQSIQYLGNENFSTDDKIQVSAMNKNGVNNIEVPIFVEPINDPPFINAPEFIILEKKSSAEEFVVYDRKRDKFDFSVGDPDLLNFPGNKSNFLVMFSVEVNFGFLSTNLPAELISTTELKLKSSHQWQPLQTFVTISKHFMVKAKGIRFRGSVDHSNIVLQKLSYNGGEHGSVLTVRINDMGNYGCYPDCADMMSMPLLAEASVILISRQPMSSLLAHTLGSAIMIEFVVMISVGVMLLFFICKCVIVLIREKRRHAAENVQLSSIPSSHERTSSADSSEDVTNFAGCCPSKSLLSRKPSNTHEQSCRQCGEDAHGCSTLSSDLPRESPVPGFMPFSCGEGQVKTL